jgi:hypothetical protein
MHLALCWLWCGVPDAGHVCEMVGDRPGGRHKAVQEELAPPVHHAHPPHYPLRPPQPSLHRVAR